MFGATVFIRDDFGSDRAEECRLVLTNPDTDTFVVENDCSIIGFAAAHVALAGAELEDIWLHPNSWGSGAAAVLVSAIQEEALSTGASRLSAWVPEDSPSGRRFFDKIGWRPTGKTEPLALYADEPNLLFEYEHHIADMNMTRGMPRPLVPQ